MHEDDCRCCTFDIEVSTSRPSPTTVIADEPILDASFPVELIGGLEDFAGEEPIRNLADWVTVIEGWTGDHGITTDDLCQQDGPTDHRGRVDGETSYFSCFLDAILFAGLIDTDIDIRTASPDGTEIDLYLAEGTLEQIQPLDALFSFGIDERVSPDPAIRPTRSEIYQAQCPYVRAFPAIDAYQDWARNVPGITVAYPMRSVTSFTDALLTA